MPYGSPNEMGHSPAEMESAKQETKNLLKDMPVDSRASALQMSGSWMSKHSKSAMMMKGPMEMGHEGSPAEKHCM